MGISGRGQKQNSAAAPAKTIPLCPRCGKKFPWVPKNIGIHWTDGPLNVCARACCVYCGKTKKNSEGEKVVFCTIGDGYLHASYENFNVPRELCEEAVFNNDGTALLNAAGKQVYAYAEAKKIDFVKKLLGLVDWDSQFDQYFAPARVTAADLSRQSEAEAETPDGEAPV